MITKIHKLKDQNRRWFLVDAKGQILGRLSTSIADALRGKDKATYTPNTDTGDNVVVINAREVMLSKETKRGQKTYYRHSGYPGGIRQETFEEAIEKHPERVIELAVKGMMPKNKLAKMQLKRLKIYAGNDHPHTQELIKFSPDGELGPKVGE